MIFAVLAENFTRKNGNAKASSHTTLGSAIILREANNPGKKWEIWVAIVK